jgi:uncharacterized ferritin-like protein (DUF455 family)
MTALYPDRDLPPPLALETVERWAWDYIVTTDLAHKLAPPPPPRIWEEAAPPRRLLRPGRPAALIPSRERFKTPGPVALRSPQRRAQLLHTFLHHELQAAELLCWAILAFPDTPRAFRSGLVAIAQDEVRHMGMYAAHIGELGHRYGDFPVRDWFWERVPTAPSPAHFVASLGMGFEGANIDHTMRFAARFRAVDDHAGAALEERICAEEIPHVRFALHWFRTFTGRDDFASWTEHLPPPLSPLLMRGTQVHREGRLRSGFSEAFVDELTRWRETLPGS